VIKLDVILYYIIITNAVSAIICILDKAWAKRGYWLRMPEKTLFVWAISGGATGMYITMLLIRHKTLHKRFMIGLPIIIFIQCLVLLGILYLMHATA